MKGAAVKTIAVLAALSIGCATGPQKVDPVPKADSFGGTVVFGSGTKLESGSMFRCVFLERARDPNGKMMENVLLCYTPAEWDKFQNKDKKWTAERR